MVKDFELFSRLVEIVCQLIDERRNRKSQKEIILYIQRLPQRSPDSAVTGPVEIGPIPMRATASTGGSKPRLSTQYIMHLCRRRHSCQRGTNTIALLCLLCQFST
jgi:hypothetical protein